LGNNYFLNNFNNLVHDDFYWNFSKKFVGYLSNILLKSFFINCFFLKKNNWNILSSTNFIFNNLNIKIYFYKSLFISKLWITNKNIFFGNKDNVSLIFNYAKYNSIFDTILKKKEYYKNYMTDFFFKKNYFLFKYSLNNNNFSHNFFLLEKSFFLFLNYYSNKSYNEFSFLTFFNKYKLSPIIKENLNKYINSNLFIYKNIFKYLIFKNIFINKFDLYILKIYKLYSFMLFFSLENDYFLKIYLKFSNYLFNKIYLKLLIILNKFFVFDSVNSLNMLNYYYILLILKNFNKI
jgi:hypothetical protein